MAESSKPERKPRRRRSPGEGSVFPYRDGHRGTLKWTDYDGTTRQRTVYGRTPKEARDKLYALRNDLRLGTLSAGPDVTLADYLPGWLARYRAVVRPGTWDKSEMHVRCYLLPSLGRVPLVQLRSADVERAQAAWLKDGMPVKPEKRGRGRKAAGGVSPLTVRHIRATLRRALSDALRDGLVVRNAAGDARPPYVPHKPIAYLSARDIRTLIVNTADTELGPLWALAATTGLRLGELLGLTWGDIGADGTLSVRRSMARTASGFGLADPKSARSRRTLPLPAEARKALETQRTRQLFAKSAAGALWQDREGLVFTDTIGRPWPPANVSRTFAKVPAAAGIPDVRLHDLRHSAATTLLAAGVPLAVISEWLGHSGIAITAQAYAAIVPELRKEAADAMDRALAADA